jgi:hypothetical protein
MQGGFLRCTVKGRDRILNNELEASFFFFFSFLSRDRRREWQTGRRFNKQKSRGRKVVTSTIIEERVQKKMIDASYERQPIAGGKKAMFGG